MKKFFILTLLFSLFLIAKISFASNNAPAWGYCGSTFDQDKANKDPNYGGTTSAGKDYDRNGEYIQ